MSTQDLPPKKKIVRTVVKKKVKPGVPSENKVIKKISGQDSKPENTVEVFDEWDPVLFNDAQTVALAKLERSLNSLNGKIDVIDGFIDKINKIEVLSKKIDRLMKKVEEVSQTQDELVKKVGEMSERESQLETHLLRMESKVQLYHRQSEEQRKFIQMEQEDVSKAQTSLQEENKRLENDHQELGEKLDLIQENYVSKDEIDKLFKVQLDNIQHKLDGVKDEMVVTFETESKLCSSTLVKEMGNFLEGLKSKGTIVKCVERDTPSFSPSQRLTKMLENSNSLFSFQSGEPSRRSTFAGKELVKPPGMISSSTGSTTSIITETEKTENTDKSV